MNNIYIELNKIKVINNYESYEGYENIIYINNFKFNIKLRDGVIKDYSYIIYNRFLNIGYNNLIKFGFFIERKNKTVINGK